MARISGIDLPREKRIEIALTYIFGIGLPTAQKLLAQTGVNPNVRVKDLSSDDENKLREAVDAMKVEGDLRREIAGHIKRLTDIGCYRGLRHRRGLPVRGQRTKTNARTRRAPSARSPARRRPRQEVTPGTRTVLPASTTSTRACGIFPPRAVVL